MEPDDEPPTTTSNMNTTSAGASLRKRSSWTSTSSIKSPTADIKSQVLSDHKPETIELDILDDIKSPFETEAEEAILRAIEEAEKKKSAAGALEQGGGVPVDRDNIFSNVPVESLHLFGDAEREEEELPSVFSLKSLDAGAGATHSKSRSSDSKFKNIVKKVQLVRNMATAASTRPRVSSLESAEASLVYSTNSRHSRIPSNIPATPPTHVETMHPFEPSHKAPELFEIVDQMKTFENLTRQNTTRRLSNSQYAEVPTRVNSDEELLGNEQGVDPESLIHSDACDDLGGVFSSDYPRRRDGNKRRDSKRATNVFLHRCCSPCFAFKNLVSLQWRNIKRFFKAIFFLLVPVLSLAFILFYFAGNPGSFRGASYSWWCLFAIRLGITLTLARITEFLLIDYIALETNLTVRFIGRLLTLMLIQSKGWPILCVYWGIWNFALVHGNERFAKHWLYWTAGTLKIFGEEENPSGGITSNRTYTVILITMIITGVVIMVKRLLVSLLLGKKKYVTYGPKMEKIMRKILLIAEVAILAEEIAFAAQNTDNNMISRAKSPARGWLFEHYREQTNADEEEDEEDEEESMTETDASAKRRKNSDIYDFPVEQQQQQEDDQILPSSLRQGNNDRVPQDSVRRKAHQKFIQWVPFKKNGAKKEIKKLLDTKESELEKLLGEWEEPETVHKVSWADTSIRKILQFRESLKYLDGPHPLSVPFGLADTRRSCCKSAQQVYDRLLMKTPGASVLHFDTISLLALGPDGKLQQDKARALIRLFRPHRNGDLTRLDFVRSCDKIYRRARMFRATTLASAQLDDAFEQLINIAFYFITGFVVLVVVGFDTTRIFSFSAGIFSLSFMFGASASRYLEGVLLVLARQPFDVGDRIAISDPQSDTSTDGSLTWFVENISLYQTTVRQGATNEIATYSNSSLAHSRIINAARSPKAMTFVYLKFGIDVPYSKVMIFKDVVEKYVKERPRQFIKLEQFRATSVEADLGYIKYVIVLLHVDSWQNIGEILQAKADLASFCLEVQKKMDMRYVAPPMPIDLSLTGRKLLPGEAAEIGLADFSSTTSAEVPASSPFEQEFSGRYSESRHDELPPRVPTHVKNDSVGYNTIAAMFAKDLEQGDKKKK